MLWEQATILQTAHFLNHVTADPDRDLPSRGVQKALLRVLDSQMTPFWDHVTPDPDRDLPSRGVPKRGPQKCYAFWGPRFGTRFAQILTQFASKHGPRSKIHFLDPCSRSPQYVLPSEGGPISTFFYLGSLFGHLRMVKHTEVIGHTCPKSGPNPKGALRTGGRT